jgi:hypothetical protein
MSGIAVHGRSRSGPGTRFASRGRLEGDALAADLARAAASPIVDALLRSLGTTAPRSGTAPSPSIPAPEPWTSTSGCARFPCGSTGTT